MPVQDNSFGTWQPLEMGVDVAFDGYMYIYVVNESSVGDCSFDDLTIIHDQTDMSLQISSATDYYPYGMQIASTQYINEGVTANRYQFQGDYSEYDEYTGWQAFDLRGNYDPRLGTWYSTDPYAQYASPYLGMGNSPVNGVDPDGGFFNVGAALVGAFAGAAIGAGTALILDEDVTEFALYGALFGGLAGGFLGGPVNVGDVGSNPGFLTKTRAQIEHAVTGKSGHVITRTVNGTKKWVNYGSGKIPPRHVMGIPAREKLRDKFLAKGMHALKKIAGQKIIKDILPKTDEIKPVMVDTKTPQINTFTENVTETSSTSFTNFNPSFTNFISDAFFNKYQEAVRAGQVFDIQFNADAPNNSNRINTINAIRRNLVQRGVPDSIFRNQAGMNNTVNQIGIRIRSFR